MKNKLKVFATTFMCVTTCVVFVSAIFMEIFWKNATLEIDILWEILGLSFLCSFSSMIYPDRELSKKALIGRILLHYLLINVIVLGCGMYFEWFYPSNPWMLLTMILIIAIVFAITFWVIWNQEKKEAELLNAKLKEYQEVHGQEE